MVVVRADRVHGSRAYPLEKEEGREGGGERERERERERQEIIRGDLDL